MIEYALYYVNLATLSQLSHFYITAVKRMTLVDTLDQIHYYIVYRNKFDRTGAKFVIVRQAVHIFKNHSIIAKSLNEHYDRLSTLMSKRSEGMYS